MKRKILFLGMLSVLVFSFNSCKKDDEALPLKDITLTYDLSLPVGLGYDYTAQKIDSAAICTAFGGISYTEFTTLLADGDIVYTALKPDGTIDETASTAAAPGHWFDADGNVATWTPALGAATVFSEYANNNFYFKLGQYPGATTVGTTYTIKQGFLYTKDATSSALATIVFNIGIIAK
jgi:hypothetical protein